MSDTIVHLVLNWSLKNPPISLHELNARPRRQLFALLMKQWIASSRVFTPPAYTAERIPSSSAGTREIETLAS